MKPLQLLVASAIVAALVLSPLAVGAGSITFSSPASGASYKGTQSYSITGAVSPIPSQPDNVFVSVKSPGGLTVDAGSVSVSVHWDFHLRDGNGRQLQLGQWHLHDNCHGLVWRDWVDNLLIHV